MKRPPAGRFRLAKRACGRTHRFDRNACVPGRRGRRSRALCEGRRDRHAASPTQSHPLRQTKRPPAGRFRLAKRVCGRTHRFDRNARVPGRRVRRSRASCEGRRDRHAASPTQSRLPRRLKSSPEGRGPSPRPSAQAPLRPCSGRPAARGANVSASWGGGAFLIACGSASGVHPPGTAPSAEFFRTGRIDRVARKRQPRRRPREPALAG
jgi:hypothetical protein